MAKTLGPKRRGDRFGNRCKDHTRRKSELHMVSAAKLGPGRGRLALHSLPHRSPGQIQAGLSTGKAGAGASEQWAQVAERAGVREEQREGRKWQLPQPSPHPTSWREGRWDWC